MKARNTQGSQAAQRKRSREKRWQYFGICSHALLWQECISRENRVRTKLEKSKSSNIFQGWSFPSSAFPHTNNTSFGYHKYKQIFYTEPFKVGGLSHTEPHMYRRWHHFGPHHMHERPFQRPFRQSKQLNVDRWIPSFSIAIYYGSKLGFWSGLLVVLVGVVLTWLLRV